MSRQNWLDIFVKWTRILSNFYLFSSFLRHLKSVEIVWKMIKMFNEDYSKFDRIFFFNNSISMCLYLSNLSLFSCLNQRSTKEFYYNLDHIYPRYFLCVSSSEGAYDFVYNVLKDFLFLLFRVFDRVTVQ